MEGLRHFWAIFTLPDNIPISALLVLVPFFTWIAFRQAFETDREIARGKTPAEAVLGPEAGLPEKLHVWPYLLRAEFLSAIACMIIMMVWSIVLDAPLEEPANANITPNPSKAPWYFLGLQELLVYFDPWIAGVVLPTIIIVGLMAIPYIDVNPKGVGYYTWKERRFAISLFCLGFIIMWVSFIILGTFMRGPGWMLFMPWQPWDKHMVLAEVNRDLAEFIGIDSRGLVGSLLGAVFCGSWFLAWLVAPWFWLKKNRPEILARLGPIRYVVVSQLFASMMFVLLKVVLRLAFAVKYFWVTPWFNV